MSESVSGHFMRYQVLNLLLKLSFKTPKQNLNIPFIFHEFAFGKYTLVWKYIFILLYVSGFKLFLVLKVSLPSDLSTNSNHFGGFFARFHSRECRKGRDSFCSIQLSF